MIDIDAFMKDFVYSVKKEFNERLWFMGLQGSYARGEASESSDIDIVVILDKLTVRDIERYNELLDTVSHRELMCGFLSGKQELLNWNASELFQFFYDTNSVIGNLDELLQLLDEDTIDKAVRDGACSIYHACVHNMLYEKNMDILKSLYKSAVFVIQAIHFKQTGRYISERSELIKAVESDNRLILSNYFNKDIDFKQKSESLFFWAQRIINANDKIIDYRIIPYEEKYFDDLIFMILEAKDALGKVPSINKDLFDIRVHYFDKGDMFWLAVDSDDRVIGSVGYSSIEGSDDVRLHRLYIKKILKRRGIGTALLKFAENYLINIGKKNVLIHLGGDEYFELRQFYPKHGYVYYADRYMKKQLFQPDYSCIIGKMVSGIIERPIGSRHPDYHDIIYTVNYGYIPDIMAGDNEEQDVYYLGENKPAASFKGRVIAVYHRINDNEDKWIVSDKDDYTDEEILKAIDFQEKYFTGRLYR